MNRKESSNEFQALIDEEGNIAVPPELMQRFAGRKLHVRLNSEEVSAELKKKNVTEQEIERISGMQRESREQAVKFLLSEGALRSASRFVRRVGGSKR